MCFSFARKRYNVTAGLHQLKLPKYTELYLNWLHVHGADGPFHVWQTEDTLRIILVRLTKYLKEVRTSNVRPLDSDQASDGLTVSLGFLLISLARSCAQTCWYFTQLDVVAFCMGPAVDVFLSHLTFYRKVCARS
jgi:hypothetical protein